MILDPLASHPISDFCASFLNKRPTPSECGASSSSCPEYNINSPVVNRSCPDRVHRVSQSPSTARVNPRSSAVTWAVFPASYIVRMFQVLMFKVFLVERRVIGIVASFRLSPQHVIWAYALVNQTLPLPGRKYCFHLLCMFL